MESTEKIRNCLSLGIASLLLYPDDESGDSSQQEEEESEAGETDEQDATEDLTLSEEQLERRASQTGHGTRSNLAPQTMQWAIRTRETRGGNRASGVRVTSGNSLVFIDPTSLRRSTSAAVAAAATQVKIMKVLGCYCSHNSQKTFTY